MTAGRPSIRKRLAAWLWAGLHQRVRLVALVCVMLAMANAVTGMVQQSWTYDEGNHIGWTYRLLQGCDLDQSYYIRGVEAPDPIPDCLTSRQHYWGHATTTPGTALHVLFGSTALQLTPSAMVDEDSERIALRLAGLLWLGLAFALVWQLAALVSPLRAAPWLAVAMVALDPNFAAHASVVTADLPMTVGTLMTLASLMLLIRQSAIGGWAAGSTAAAQPAKPKAGLATRAFQRLEPLLPVMRAAAVLGVSFGIVLATKLTALLLLPAFVFALLAVPQRLFARAALGRLALGLGVAAIVSVLVLNFAYLWQGEWHRLDSWRFSASLMQQLQTSLPGWLILPAPETYIEGVDITLARERGAWWNVVLLGQHFPQGYKGYFAVTMALKTPLLLLAGILAGLVASVIWGRQVINWRWRFLALCVLGWALYFSFMFKAQTGHRYLLPFLPALYVIAAAGLARLLLISQLRSWSRYKLVVPVVLLALCAGVTTLRDFGNPLGFTNAFVLDRSMAWQLLADSNIDWGQSRNKGMRWGADWFRAPTGFGGNAPPGQDVATRILADSAIDWGRARRAGQGMRGERLLSLTNFDQYGVPDDRRREELATRHGWRGALVFNPPDLVPGGQLLEINWWTGIFGGHDRFAEARELFVPDQLVDHTLLGFHLSDDQHHAWLERARQVPTAQQDLAPCIRATPVPSDMPIEAADCPTLCVSQYEERPFGYRSHAGMLGVTPLRRLELAHEYWQGQQGWLLLHVGTHILKLEGDAAFQALPGMRVQLACLPAAGD